MRANPDVQKHWENINVIHNERKEKLENLKKEFYLIMF